MAKLAQARYEELVLQRRRTTADRAPRGGGLRSPAGLARPALDGVDSRKESDLYRRTGLVVLESRALLGDRRHNAGM
jgi:hypothetical protein